MYVITHVLGPPYCGDTMNAQSQGLTIVHCSAQRTFCWMSLVHEFPPVYLSGGHGEV